MKKDKKKPNIILTKSVNLILNMKNAIDLRLKNININSLLTASRIWGIFILSFIFKTSCSLVSRDGKI